MIDWKTLFSVMLISAFIGIGVSGLFQYLSGESFCSGIIYGATSGAVIGFLSHCSFFLVYITLSKNPLLALLSVMIIIGLGTSLFCYIWNVPFPVPAIPIISVSETVGVIATLTLFYNYRRLNEKLDRKKKSLSSESEKDLTL